MPSSNPPEECDGLNFGGLAGGRGDREVSHKAWSDVRASGEDRDGEAADISQTSRCNADDKRCVITKRGGTDRA